MLEGAYCTLFPIAVYHIKRHTVWPGILLGMTLGHLWVHCCHQLPRDLLLVQHYGIQLALFSPPPASLVRGQGPIFREDLFHWVAFIVDPHSCCGCFVKDHFLLSSAVELPFSSVPGEDPSSPSSSSSSEESDMNPPPTPLFPCCTSGCGSKELQGGEGLVIRVFSGHFPTLGFRHGRHVYWHPGYRPHLNRYQIDRSPGPNCDQLATDLSGPFCLA